MKRISLSLTFIGGSVVVASLLSGCGKNLNAGAKGKVQDLSLNPTRLTWTQSNGTVSPQAGFRTKYVVDFQTNDLQVSSSAGAAVTKPMPRSKTIRLTAGEIANLNQAFGQIGLSSCAQGDRLMGGATDELSVSTRTQSTSLTIHNSNCAGFSSSDHYQATSGFEVLTAYLQSL